MSKIRGVQRNFCDTYIVVRRGKISVAERSSLQFFPYGCYVI